MEYYDEWIFRKSNNCTFNDVDRMMDFIDNLQNYSIIKLLDYYYHLIDFHSKHLIEENINNNNDIYKLINCNCNDCVALMRHYKDLSIKNKDYKLKKNYILLMKIILMIMIIFIVKKII